MLTLWIFLFFALCLAWTAQELSPYAPLLKLRLTPCCALCGRRGWRMAT